MRVFSFLSSLSPPLSLSWVCATSVGSVVMFLCSEWIHQHKNVLIIFIFYYTTRKPCQLGCRALGKKRERRQKGGREGRRELKMGWGWNNVNKKQNKERGTAKDRGINKEWSNRGRGSKDDEPVAVVEKQNRGRELRRHPEIGCDSNIQR